VAVSRIEEWSPERDVMRTKLVNSIADDFLYKIMKIATK